MKIIFSHGKESGPKATKITAMQTVASELNIETESLDYRGLETVETRVEKLLEYIEQECRDEKIVLVGSSMGAYVSLVASQKLKNVIGLFLLAPAVHFPGYEVEGMSFENLPTSIIHGWNDEIIPVEKAIQFAQEYQLAIQLVADDHRLSESIPLINEQFRSFLNSLKTL